ncbi:MAG: biopolymer transporter ExbD [Proteobacteria bacterium]|nr:biopolymer transporter ExbD [Pseudomonadota bacterium]MBU1714100.1 biopolymer transporter ExbD [Pseudomonadota bacterium]
MRRVRDIMKNRDTQVAINMAPLIDMVFLLLIFFIVTTSFVKETGIEVQRPVASTAVLQDQGSILVGVDENGEVFFNKKKIDIRSVRYNVEKALAESPGSSVVLVADKLTQAGVLITVMDGCRLAGATDISIATELADEDS